MGLVTFRLPGCEVLDFLRLPGPLDLGALPSDAIGAEAVLVHSESSICNALRLCLDTAVYAFAGRRAAATGSASPHKRGAPISSHNFISFNNIANILRYLYEKPPHNSRKCG